MGNLRMPSRMALTAPLSKGRWGKDQSSVFERGVIRIVDGCDSLDHRFDHSRGLLAPGLRIRGEALKTSVYHP